MKKLFWVACGFLLSSCTTRYIAGTDIRDNSDNRAILGVLEQYRAAVEARDVEALAKLLAEDFHDNAGTADPADDLNAATLRANLSERWPKLSDVSVDLSVRKIEVKDDVANAIYYYTARFRMPKLTSKPQNEGDLKQMWLKKVNGEWKIVSGI